MKLMQSWVIGLIVVLTWGPVPVLSAEPKILLNSATEGGETRRYTTEKPPEGWIKPEFDDRTWSDGKMGFGVVDQVTPASTIGTPWKTADIWLRKTIEAPATADFQTVALRVRHDEDVEVYLNGRLIFSEPGFNTHMTAFDVTKEWKAAARSSKNTLALHVHQTASGQYIDLGLVLDPKEKLVLPVPRIDAAALQQLRDSRWTPKKAWTWYKGIGPIRGFNYVPRTAVNTTEMWQKETFDPRTIDEELGWAERCGLNSARVFVQYIVYEADPHGLIGRMERFLEIAEKHHISVMFILFDDCFIPEPKLGKQPDPVPGVHNSQWTASPGNRRKQPENWSALEKYVKHVVGHFAKDQRIVAWDLYNEASAPSRPLVEMSFAWARAAQPSQPLTSCWQALDLSDVISFHDYGPPNAVQLDRWITERPALCTECIARGAGSRFDNVLPAFAKHGIGWYMWGLVKGRIQTYYPWGSPKGAPEPKLWHHDLLQPDGTPYRPEEIEQIHEFCRDFNLPNRTGSSAPGPTAAPALPSESKATTQPYRGVTYIDYRGTSPRRVHMHIVQIDLTTPGIGFLVTPYNPRGGKATMKETALQFLKTHRPEGARVAINAHFFEPWPAPSPDPGSADLVGLAASSATLKGPGAAHRAPHAYSPFTSCPPKSYAIMANAPGLNFDPANHATIVHRLPGDATGYATKEGVALYNTVAGCAQIITDGIDTTPRLDWHEKPLKPRTAAGLSKDNRTLTLFTVDAAGDSPGMTVKEVVKFLLDDTAGLWPPGRRVHNAICLDDGGSTTLAMVDPRSGTASVVNAPSGGSPRAVGSNLALLVRDTDGMAAPLKFRRHLIDTFPAGYQVAVADINGDGRPDVIALSTEADRVDWYENPGWQRHPLARTAKNIDLAVRDLGHNGRPMIALASGFYFSESARGGEIQILRQPAKPDDLWQRAPIAVDPVVHRLRWGDLEGNGRPVLIHAPIFGPGSQGTQAPKPAHLWAFRPPRRPEQPWDVWKIDESLTVLHGIQVVDLDGDGRDEILTASFEGIHRFDFKGQGQAARWRKVQLARGALPVNDKPGTARGSSEVATFHLAKGRMMLAAIEPWHGNQVVVYSPPEGEGLWHRHVIDDTLQEGHALVVGDFDGDGMDEIVAGWRAGGGGLRLYKATDATGREFKSYDLDPGMPAECAVAADINGDGKLDLVVIGGRKNQLVWYENRTPSPAKPPT